MRVPTRLRSLDDRVIGSRRPAPDGAAPEGAATERQVPPGPGTGRGARELLAGVGRVSRLVLLALAAVVALGIAFTLLPTNPDNAIVSGVLSLAERAAGPFVDVFTVDGERARVAANHGLAAVVYVVAASLVRRVPGLGPA